MIQVNLTVNLIESLEREGKFFKHRFMQLFYSQLNFLPELAFNGSEKNAVIFWQERKERITTELDYEKRIIHYR